MAESARATIEEHAALAVRARFLAASIRQSPTGMNAHYAIDSLPPGRYAVWAETQIGDHFYQWIATTTIERSPVTLDLDNAAVKEGGVYCGFRANTAWFR